MINKLQEAKTIQDFNDFVIELNPEIGDRGGRYFTIGKYSYSMNQIVDQFKKCVNDTTFEDQDLDSTTMQLINKGIRIIDSLDSDPIFNILMPMRRCRKTNLQRMNDFKKFTGNLLYRITHQWRTRKDQMNPLRAKYSNSCVRAKYFNSCEKDNIFKEFIEILNTLLKKIKYPSNNILKNLNDIEAFDKEAQSIKKQYDLLFQSKLKKIDELIQENTNRRKFIFLKEDKEQLKHDSSLFNLRLKEFFATKKIVLSKIKKTHLTSVQELAEKALKIKKFDVKKDCLVDGSYLEHSLSQNLPILNQGLAAFFGRQLSRDLSRFTELKNNLMNVADMSQTVFADIKELMDLMKKGLITQQELQISTFTDGIKIITPDPEGQQEFKRIFEALQSEFEKIKQAFDTLEPEPSNGL